MDLPADCVAIPSDRNNNPLASRYSEGPNVVMQMVERTQTRVRFTAQNATAHAACYIGAILSADRETIYWVNETNPLP